MLRISVFLSGLVFGLGLIISGMTNPQKVIGFLDVFGAWDPSLAFVMGGAIGVAFFAFGFAKKRNQSLLGEPMCLPQNTSINPRLVIGSLLFGAGWGLSGFCPGPAIVSLGSLDTRVFVLVGAMLVSIFVVGHLLNREL